MGVRTLEIDGRTLTGVEGETVFTVAWHHQIRIPRLCHLGGVSDVGACRLCLVEIEGQKRLQASCLVPAEEGMVVRTDTPRLRAHRKLLLELLLAERNHVCAVCVSNGQCELQELASSLGVDHVRPRYRFPRLEVDLSHERFGLDHNRCVLCTRCLRTCAEVEGAHTWDLAGRGASVRVISDLGDAWGESESCTGCGKCVQVCPTGALFLQGSTAGEMTRDRSFLKYIVKARTRGQWIR